MARDPHGNKIGRNDHCWCGSGLKYKHCHYDRESQDPHDIGRYAKRFYDTEKTAKFCSCTFGGRRCDEKIIAAHSISKSASLEQIADAGHVITLEIDPKFSHQTEAVAFKKIGINKASTVKAFCSYHDHALFSELDRLDLKNTTLFFWQLLYRTVCFERYRKFVAMKFSSHARDLDRGQPVEQQIFWQDYVSRQEIGHSGGLKQLDDLRLELEALYQAARYVDELKYLYFVIPSRLPVAAAGAFQPDLAPDGTKLQAVNQMRVVDGKIEYEALDGICMSILPSQNETLLSMCALKSHQKSMRFMQRFLDIAPATVDSFVGLVLTKIENVYFNPLYVSSLNDLGKHKLKTLHSFGIGQDLEQNEISLAMRLGLFPPYNRLQSANNIR